MQGISGGLLREIGDVVRLQAALQEQMIVGRARGGDAAPGVELPGFITAESVGDARAQVVGDQSLSMVARLGLNAVFPGLGELFSFARPLLDKLGLGKLFGSVSEKLFGGLFKPKTLVEQERWQKLAEAGYPFVPPGATDPRLKQYVEKGQLIRPDLPGDFVGEAPDGTWLNNKYSQSRSEADLTGRDIWGYATWAEKFGVAWGQTTGEAREAIANKALALGLVREHHGTIDVRWTPELEAFASEALGKV